MTSGLKPLLIAHCDWSTTPRKRWLAIGRVGADGAAAAGGPELVGDTSTLLRRLRQRAGGAPVLIGFDFPVGLPLAYAELAGITAFRPFLERLATDAATSFFDPAPRPEDISVDRPFYPAAPGGSAHAHVLEALGVTAMDELRRSCELPTDTRRAAAPLFWLVGAAQVGRAAIAGWREVLIPALAEGVGLWPFDGDLHRLLDTCEVVVAETYPTEFYGHLGAAPGPGGKRQPAGRQPACTALREAAGRLGVALEPMAQRALAEAFGEDQVADDRFDAFVGLLGMLGVVMGHRAPGPPASLPPATASIEGWILGQ